MARGPDGLSIGFGGGRVSIRIHVRIRGRIGMRVGIAGMCRGQMNAAGCPTLRGRARRQQCGGRALEATSQSSGSCFGSSRHDAFVEIISFRKDAAAGRRRRNNGGVLHNDLRHVHREG